MQHLDSAEVNKHLDYWILNFQNASQPLIQAGIQKFIQRQPGMMKEYFNGDSEVTLEALENEVDYEQEADWNHHLAVIEAFTAVGVCMEEGGDDEVDIKVEAEVKKKEEEWKKKAAEVLWQAVYEA